MISKFGNKSMQASHEVQKSVNILQSNPDSEADFESIQIKSKFCLKYMFG